MGLLSPEKDLAICRLLVGWDALEKRLDGNPVIDFNLPGFTDPDADTRYATREAVLDDLQKLQQDGEIKSDKRIAQKLRAQEAYLRNVMGEHWGYDAYIQSTQGFTPHIFSEEEIAKQRLRAETCLDRWNIGIGKNLIEEMDKVQAILSPDRAEILYQTILDRNAKGLATIIGPIPDFNFDVEFTATDKSWLNWADGNQKSYRLRVNETKMPSLGESYLTWLALHEVTAHMVHSVMAYDRIEQNQLSRCMGITTVHGPEQFVFEGVAQTLPLFLRTEDTMDPLVQAYTELYIYERMVISNGRIGINSGHPAEEVLDYIVADLPHFSNRFTPAMLEANVTNPQFRSYSQVYGASAFFFRDIALRANDDQKKQFLQRIYHDWLPFDELVTFRNQLLSPQSGFGAASHKYGMAQP